MKLFGYEEGNGDQLSPIRLSEVSILTSPSELRAIAKVLNELAAEMESDGFDHVHLTDRLSDLGCAELIVAKAK